MGMGEIRGTALGRREAESHAPHPLCLVGGGGYLADSPGTVAALSLRVGFPPSLPPAGRHSASAPMVAAPLLPLSLSLLGLVCA